MFFIKYRTTTSLTIFFIIFFRTHIIKVWHIVQQVSLASHWQTLVLTRESMCCSLSTLGYIFIISVYASCINRT